MRKLDSRSFRFVPLLPILFVLAGTGALLSPGCSNNPGGLQPLTVGESQIRIEQGNVVRWETERPTRGAVRYGFEPGEYDHVAYPRARQQEDRAFVQEHLVPLLDVRPGMTVYFQILNQVTQGQIISSDELSFIAQAEPVLPLLTSTMIHVGWGDAHLITMPTTGKRILIDGGYPGAAEALRYHFEEHGIQDIDAALATHIHADHIGGFVGVDINEDGRYEIPGALARFGAESFVDSPSKVHFRSLYGELGGLLSQLDIERRVVRRGDSDQTFAEFASWDPSVRVSCLNSGRADDVPIKNYEGDNINNESIVLRFSYRDVDFIIGGDCERECEISITNAFRAAELEAEYYKAHHHGRYDGSASELLRAINPRIALIPVSWKEYRGGWDEYLDESSDALTRLAQARIDWYAVDDQPLLDRRQSIHNYNITFATDGLSYELRFERALQPTKIPIARTWADDCGHPVLHDHSSVTDQASLEE